MMPYRRAVNETRREPLRLSATIRSFSSSVQCWQARLHSLETFE
jgi:hypothetical protein